MPEQSAAGVYVSLDQIYETAKQGAQAADGARNDIAALRTDVQGLSGRMNEVEKQLKSGAPAYLKTLGYSIGLLAAGVAAGWASFKGGG